MTQTPPKIPARTRIQTTILTCVLLGLIGWLVADLPWGGSPAAAGEPAQREPAQQGRAADVQAIRAHIDSIFHAYMEGDRETIRATHSDDWRGFLRSSRSILQGIEDYMETADANLQTPSRMTGYEMVEIDVHFLGDIALVPYIAALDVVFGGELIKPRPKLRVLDVYAKRNGEWIQVASNTDFHPDTQEDIQRLPWPVQGPLREEILAAREKVWRAWFANDRSALEWMIPQETIAIGAGIEAWRGRPEILAGAAGFVEQGGRLLELEFPKTEIQLYGDIAILYTLYAFTYQDSEGEPTRLSGRGTEIFVRRDEGWVNPGWHLDSGS